MKRVVLCALFGLISGQIMAQTLTKSDSLRKELKQYLVEIKDSSFPDEYDMYNLIITNLITDKVIDNIDDDSDSTCIYSFEGFGSHLVAHILLKHDGKYEIIEMPNFFNGKPYSDSLLELMAYFSRWQDIDRNLLPQYVRAMTKLYFTNIGEGRDFIY